MILVTLGTQDKQFTRLLKAIEEQVKKGLIKDKIIVQAGHTKFKSKYMKILKLIPMEQFDKLISECDVLITHGGVGSIITGLKYNKKVIAAARLSKYNEHENDHQLQIIETFVNDGYILELNDFDKLNEKIKESKKFKSKKFKNDNKVMKKIVNDYISNNEISTFRFLLPFIIILVLLIIIFI